MGRSAPNSKACSPDWPHGCLKGSVSEVRETILVLAEEKRQLIEVETEKLFVLADPELSGWRY